MNNSRTIMTNKKVINTEHLIGKIESYINGVLPVGLRSVLLQCIVELRTAAYGNTVPENDDKNETSENILKFFSELASKQESLPADCHVSVEQLLDFEDDMIIKDKFSTVSEVTQRLVNTPEREQAIADARKDIINMLNDALKTDLP